MFVLYDKLDFTFMRNVTKADLDYLAIIENQ